MCIKIYRHFWLIFRRNCDDYVIFKILFVASPGNYLYSVFGLELKNYGTNRYRSSRYRSSSATITLRLILNKLGCCLPTHKHVMYVKIMTKQEAISHAENCITKHMRHYGNDCNHGIIVDTEIY